MAWPVAIQGASNIPHLQDPKTGAVSQDDARHREVYYKAIKEKIAVKIKMARLVHVGLPRSGKSSTIKRLMGDIMNLLELKRSVSASSPDAAEQAKVITARSLCSDLAAISVDPEDPNSFQWLKLKGFVEEDSFLTHLLEAVQKDAADITSSSSSEPTAKPLASDSSPDKKAHTLVKRKTIQELLALPQDAREREVNDIKSLLRDLDHLILLINTDTGGKPEFYDMFSSLIMGPSLYLLYHRLNDPLDKPFKLASIDSDGEYTLEEEEEESMITVEESLFQVLASIASFSDPSIRDTCSVSSQDSTESMCRKFPIRSRALFVGTHLDELKSKKELLEKQKFLKERVENMSLYKDGTLLFPARNEPILAVDNFKGLDSEKKNIKNILAKIINHHFQEITIPAAWLILSLYMRKNINSASRRRIMFLEDCKEQAGKLGIDPTELKEALWFLHHCMGLIFYYPGVKGVEDKIFCDVQVIYDGITQLIAHTFSDPTRTGPGIIEKFKERGMFSDEDLRCAMQPCSDESNELPLDQLVKLLEHLKILIVISSKSTGKKTYFMPCALKSATAAELKTELNSIVTSKNNPAPLMLQYDCGYMPVGIFSHMITDFTFQWELTEDEKICKNMIKFSYKTNQVVLISRPSYIAIALSRGPRCSIPNKEICSTIRERIESSLDTLAPHMDYKSNSLQYKFGFECIHDSGHAVKEHLALRKGDEDFLKCQVNQRILDLTESQRVWFQEVEVRAKSLSQAESEIDFSTVEILSEVKEFSKDLSPDELAQWLLLKHVPKGDCDKIKGAGISGQLFMSLTEVKLKGRYKIDLTPVGMDTIITLQEDLRPIPADVETSLSTSQQVESDASAVPPDEPEVKEFSENLSAAELALWLQSKHVPKDDCNIIRDSGISGRLFMSLTEEKLERYKIDDIGPIGLDTIMTLQEEMKEKKKAANSGCASPSATAGKKGRPLRLSGREPSVDKGVDYYEAWDRGSFVPTLKLHDNDDELTKMDPEPINQHKYKEGYYSMTFSKHGVAWIINNKVFEKLENKNAPSTRHGTDRDEDNLVRTLLFLGYRVKIYHNLKRKETIELFSRIDELLLESNKKAKTRVANDSFICCILSHGKEGKIICSDSNTVEIRLIEEMTGDSELLLGKPKIFFIQACQGGRIGDLRVEADADAASVAPRAHTTGRTHFYMCYATVGGNKSYRDRYKGSWFITEVCKVLCKKATCTSLHADFQLLINQALANDYVYTEEGFADGKEYVQTPTCSNQLQKHVHFFNF